MSGWGWRAEGLGRPAPHHAILNTSTCVSNCSGSTRNSLAGALIQRDVLQGAPRFPGVRPMGHAWRTKCSLEGCLRHKNRGIPQGKALSERKRTCRFSPHDKSQGQIIRKRTLRIRTNGTARFLCQNLSKCLHFFDYVQNRVAGSIEFAARSALGATIARCRLPAARRYPFGIARHSPAIRPCVHSLPLAVVWGRVPARHGASYSRCCSLADQISHPLGVLRIASFGVAPFDAALPGYSFHWCFFMSTQPLPRKATPSSASSARWSGKLGASRPAWLTTRWHG